MKQILLAIAFLASTAICSAANKQALIIYGGWKGHKPKEMSELLKPELEKHNIDVTLSDSLDILNDLENIEKYDLIIPMWTMGNIKKEQTKNLMKAVQKGAGLAGVHGGVVDAFRKSLKYQMMTGGQFLAHPYRGKYTVTLKKHPITEGLPESFDYNSEKYYMQVTPAINVIAETTYEYMGSEMIMPVAWTNKWGKGTVFVTTLGHGPKEYKKRPEALKLAINGFLHVMRK